MLKLFTRLKKSGLFNGLPEKRIGDLLTKFDYQLKKYPAGYMLAMRGDDCEVIYILVEGTVSGEMVDLSGKTIQVGLIHPGDVIAPAFLFGQRNRYPVNAVTQNDVLIFSMRKGDLVQMVQSDAVLLVNYLNLISDRAQFLAERLHFLSFKTIKEKFLQFVIGRLRGDQTELKLSMNIEKLSRFFGVSRPSLSRAIKELVNDQVITYENKKVRITDRRQIADILKKNK